MTTKAEALKMYRDAEAKAGQEGSRKRWRLASHALAPLTDDAAAQAAYATACATHKRADWRTAARALAAALDGSCARPVVAKAERPPASLCEFLSRAGGLQDRGGELQAMGADRWHRGGAFRRKLVNPSGLSLDYAADLAAERGYVAAFASPSLGMGADMADDLHAVAVAQLLEAIERELAGHPCYPAESDWAPYVEPEPVDADALHDEAFPGDVDYAAWADMLEAA
jgi:alkanesulfonate monooxygenase SsuD/methylene tetrahydromethanopterin reductase-like flavin-dependent oxidoreductase (luciferase family)